MWARRFARGFSHRTYTEQSPSHYLALPLMLFCSAQWRIALGRNEVNFWRTSLPCCHTTVKWGKHWRNSNSHYFLNAQYFGVFWTIFQLVICGNAFILKPNWHGQWVCSFHSECHKMNFPFERHGKAVWWNSCWNRFTHSNAFHTHDSYHNTPSHGSRSRFVNLGLYHCNPQSVVRFSLSLRVIHWQACQGPN